MSAVFILLVVCVIFVFSYRFYASRFEKFLHVDPTRKTPAHTKYDGVDYVPAKHWTVLFGHHFSSIAGAGPIVGPLLAVAVWGWLPSIIWIIIGTVFFGGVHDFCSLVISIRHDGKSIADVTNETISKHARIVFLLFLWTTLVLVISVFVYLCAKTFVSSPSIVLPSLGLIPIAIIVGFLMYSVKMSQSLVTVFGLGGLLVLIFLGQKFPIFLGSNSQTIWSIILLVYCYIASITPVQFLLQPRDYLSAFLLLFGVFFGFLGIIVTAPKIVYPAYISWHSSEGAVWPVLFITIACGAISGFHALIASGTTSKQLGNERDAKKIGYGAMVAEGIVAVMAVLLVSAAFSDKDVLGKLIGSGGPGPVGVFGDAYGMSTKKFLGIFGTSFAIMVLNSFILTTLDSATRIGRYITEELFKVKNRYLSTLVVVAMSGWLGLSGEWNQIWPVFGAANQLIAALALIVITGWFLLRRKPFWYTLVPAIIMLVTTIAALFIKIKEYFLAKNMVLFFISCVLAVMAFFIVWESIRHLHRKKKQIINYC
jgi:carbon starvation protein